MAEFISPGRYLFERMLKESGWTEADGPFPGVWRSRQRGETCLWSCVWAAPGGLVHPEDISPSWLSPGRGRLKVIDGKVKTVEEQLTPDDYELQDAIDRTGIKFKSVVEARKYYAEYTWPFGAKGANVVLYAPRPGWPAPYWHPLAAVPPRK